MPDLDRELPGYGCHRDVPAAFPSKEFPASFAEHGVPSVSQQGMRRLGEKAAHGFAPAPANSDFDALTRSAVALSGVESEVGCEFA